MASSSRQSYTFGAFRLDPLEKVLFRGNDPAPLTPKAVETLLVLVERHGHVVTKDELIRIVWPDTFVEENNLAQNISMLRRVLGESGGPQFIETVPKRGYRFVGPVVERRANDHGAVAASETEPTMQSSAWSAAASPATRQGVRRGSLMMAFAAAGVAAAILAFVAVWRSMGSTGQLRSIAVMPFEEVGLDEAHQYSGDGIADELTTQLGRESGLKVAARTSAFALKDRKMDAREIGRTLGVDALLEGSVLQAKDRVRVAVRVVNTRDGYQIWSNAWDQPLNDMPAIQAQILTEVLQVLDRGRSRRDRAVGGIPVVAPEAYQLYLQGRYLWHQRTRDSLTRSADLFERATVLSPSYAQAFSGLADAYAVLGFYDYLPPGQAFPRAKAAAQRALDLDARLAQAHASLGYVALYYDWNWAEAEVAFERAIALNPSYSVGHQWYANYLTARGRFNQAVAAMRRAQEVDPLSLIASAALGWVHFYQRDYDAAVEQCRRTLELNPRFELAHLWAGWADEAAGRYADAVRHLTEAVRLSSDGAVALASLGRAQALARDPAGARQTLAKLHRTHGAYLPAFEVAKFHLALGERDEAIAWLRRAHAERSHSIVFLSVDPQLDLLRHDARFVALESQVATPPTSDAASRTR
jgi:DNA-binding winged helix-turn-helix (wHTH) protein/TolB-like protein/Tfp pilus assembly protein PilF